MEQEANNAESNLEKSKTASSDSKGNSVSSTAPIPKRKSEDNHSRVSQKLKKTQPNHSKNNFTSQIWNRFTMIEGRDPPRAACNYYGEDYAADRHNNGTTSLWRHLENRCTKYPNKKDKSQKSIIDFAKPGAENDSAFGKIKKLDTEGIRKSLAKMVIIDELPFKMVEGEVLELILKL
ncbi:UNVERIFIED_CONTAM: hypothetical protein Sradi_5417800 [Sesamum radiatum]|uniref:BED-type domain-containing protein n=1 Tax=Sesamum radiatum TaxID=300843 RepID=A0AAW2LB50_SESRA